MDIVRQAPYNCFSGISIVLHYRSQMPRNVLERLMDQARGHAACTLKKGGGGAGADPGGGGS